MSIIVQVIESINDSLMHLKIMSVSIATKQISCKLYCFFLQLYVIPHVRMGECVWSQVSAIVRMAGKETTVEHVRMYVHVVTYQ